MPLIKDIFWQHKRRYGARRIARELAAQGEGCGVARVAKLLEKEDLKAIQPKSYRPRTTNSRHNLGYSPNLLRDRDAPTRVNEVWVGDITYVPLRGGRFGYLSVLMDLHSRRIVGWEYQESMTADLVLASLRKAIRDRQPPAHLIHHSDRGPTLSIMLAETGFPTAIYGPFYAPNKSTWHHKYDFVTASEVVEHLHRPMVDLQRTWDVLAPGGWLGIMTKRIIDREAFARWHYKYDPTHVIFFARKTLCLAGKKVECGAEGCRTSCGTATTATEVPCLVAVSGKKRPIVNIEL